MISVYVVYKKIYINDIILNHFKMTIDFFISFFSVKENLNIARFLPLTQ